MLIPRLLHHQLLSNGVRGRVQVGQVHPAAQDQRQLPNQRGRQRLTMQHSPLQIGDGKLHRYGHILLHPQVERASNQC